MSSPLQKAPDGLLGTFDLKTLGRSPNMFGDTVTPTVDVLDFYLLRNRVQASATPAAGPFAALGATISTLIVPQDEAWRLQALSIVCQRAAADAALNIELVVTLRRAVDIITGAIFTPRFEPVPATDLTQVRAHILGHPLWLGPGDSLRLISRTTMTVAGSSLGATFEFDRVAAG